VMPEEKAHDEESCAGHQTKDPSRLAVDEM
jgi:hypothetical protein